jgi:hypothetical protein
VKQAIEQRLARDDPVAVVLHDHHATAHRLAAIPRHVLRVGDDRALLA